MHRNKKLLKINDFTGLDVLTASLISDLKWLINYFDAQ